MDSKEIAQVILNELAEKYDIDLSNCSTFYEKCDRVREFIETSDELDHDSEVEITVTASFSTGEDVESLLMDNWFDYSNKNLTMEVADSGFKQSGNIESVSIEDVYTW